MERNIFKLEQEQLKEIALTLQKKVEEGLAKDNAEYNVCQHLLLPGVKVSTERLWFSTWAAPITGWQQSILQTTKQLFTLITDGKRICPL